MISDEQKSLDRKAGITFVAMVLLITLSMTVMAIYGQLGAKNKLISSEALTVLRKDVSLLKSSVLLNDNQIYSVSREFSLRLESGVEITVNRYQSNRVEICVMENCE